MRRRGEIAIDFFANRIGLFPSVKEVLEAPRRCHESVSASAPPSLDRHQLTAFFDIIITGDEIEPG